ncbi:universal stress protein [Streptomyces sp. NPDC057438]|uniref:universal stress protein n=1 Tax=Streptomyces sp. NPDC057438 TaxID=3346133 RepID=UPI0036CF4E52
MNAPVVVGVDGSSSSLDAVDLAAREAKVRGCGLTVVHALSWPKKHAPPGTSPLGQPEGGLRDMIGRMVAEAVERARSAEPEVQVTNAVVTGEPLTVLQGQSSKAALVVVGSRGLGGFAGLLLGSTAVHLAAHSHCPVLVVREQPRTARQILLGVDGSPVGDAAVEFAFAEAALRGSPLRALHAWTMWSASMPALQDDSMPYTNPAGELEDAEERLMAEALAGRSEKYPGVAVEHTVVRGGAREALIEASRDAGLLVVGARGRGGFAGLLLGSVSQALLQHAHCPVAVVRGSDAHR